MLFPAPLPIPNHRTAMRILDLACLLSVTAVALPSQTTHLVGPGGFATLPAALAVAAPGDVILVQAGTYADALDADLGVTIRALGVVQIQQSAFTQWNVPAGQTLHLDGLSFVGSLHVASGRATLANCTVTPAFGTSTPALTAKDCSVHLDGCTLTSLYTAPFASNLVGTLVENADLTAVDTSFAAGGAFVPAASVRATNSRFVASNCVFQSVLPNSGGNCVVANGGSLVWLTDSTLTSGPSACPIVATGATVRHERCTLSATTATNCAVAAPGPTLLGSTTPVLLQNGNDYAMQLRAAPSQLVAVLASSGVATTFAPGVLEQPLYLDTTSFWLAGVYVTDALGAVTITWSMPAGQFVDSPLWLQAITVEPAFPWQASPVVGGIVR